MAGGVQRGSFSGWVKGGSLMDLGREGLTLGQAPRCWKSRVGLSAPPAALPTPPRLPTSIISLGSPWPGSFPVQAAPCFALSEPTSHAGQLWPQTT